MNQQERTELVAYFIREREAIRIKKENGEPRPWSDDPIFEKFRFTNVRREDDRVTRWIKYHWRDPYNAHKNLTLAMAMARFVNWPPTLEELGFPLRWRPERVLKILAGRKARGDQTYNAAYMISTCGVKVDKAEHVVAVLDRVHTGNARPLGGDSLETAHWRLDQINGIGSFLAAQIVADLKHVHSNPLASAPDWWTWAARGPGSERGLRWWLGREKPIAAFEFLPRLHDMIKAVGPLVEGVGPLHAQDWQSVCCEMGKYCKAKESRGRPKQLYQTTAMEYCV